MFYTHAYTPFKKFWSLTKHLVSWIYCTVSVVPFEMPFSIILRRTFMLVKARVCIYISNSYWRCLDTLEKCDVSKLITVMSIIQTVFLWSRRIRNTCGCDVMTYGTWWIVFAYVDGCTVGCDARRYSSRQEDCWLTFRWELIYLQ